MEEARGQAEEPEAKDQTGNETKGRAPQEAQEGRRASETKGDQEESSAVTKLTTRIPADQLKWLKEEAKGYRERNPRRPRVTIEELITVAIDHLREAKNLDQVIAKHRS